MTSTFVLLLSSLSGVLGGLGLLSYSAANIFLDAFAARENQAGRVPWISVNWDAWQFPGQEELFRQSAPQGADFLYPAEGVECLLRILERAPGQIVVSTSDLKARIDKWIRLESVASPTGAAAGTGRRNTARAAESEQPVRGAANRGGDDDRRDLGADPRRHARSASTTSSSSSAATRCWPSS